MAEFDELIEEQTLALIRAGVNPLDAQQSAAILRQAPPGVDPRVWIPDHTYLAISPEQDVEDARADWYARVASDWKRLLDAHELAIPGTGQ